MNILVFLREGEISLEKERKDLCHYTMCPVCLTEKNGVNEVAHRLSVGEHLKKSGTFVRKYLLITLCVYITETKWESNKDLNPENPCLPRVFTQTKGCSIYFYPNSLWLFIQLSNIWLRHKVSKQFKMFCSGKQHRNVLGKHSLCFKNDICHTVHFRWHLWYV